MGELAERDFVVREMFGQFDLDRTGELEAVQLQALHAELRIGGISLPQVQAAIDYVCIGECCDVDELFEVLQEMDRRYFLIQDLRWEFSMLDMGMRDVISEEQAMWLMQMVHGKQFSRKGWERFIKQRAVPGSAVGFPEIEVDLCNIACNIGEEDEERKKMEEMEIRKREKEDAAKKVKENLKKKKEGNKKKKEEEEKRKLEEEAARKRAEEDAIAKKKKQKEEEEKKRKELEAEEERGRKEAEERARREEEEREREKRRIAEDEEEKKREQEELQEALRLKELEEKHRQNEEERRQKEAEEAKDAEQVAEDAAKAQKAAEEELKQAQEALKKAKDGKAKKEAEEAEKTAKLKQKESKNKRIRYNLKVAVKNRDRKKLPPAVEEFKKAKLPDDDMDLAAAEKLLKEFKARNDLHKAMDERELKKLEAAVNYVKRNGFEAQMASDLIEANKLLLRLRRLERIRAEILELKQSTVAEIRSYQKPPPVVVHVMTAVFIILAHKEKELKAWKTVQGLVGKTGKEGLKRRCLEAEPKKINPDAAMRAKVILEKYELDEVRDVSAGAATFYVWSISMVEEVSSLIEAKKRKEKRKAEEGAE